MTQETQFLLPDNIKIDIKTCVCAKRIQMIQDNILKEKFLKMLMGFRFYCMLTLVSYFT